jgi:tRNA-splicing ligase RtcB
MNSSKYTVIDAGYGRFIKAWMDGVKFEEKAIEQLKNTAQMPFIFKYVAAMPDTHWGMGSTVGTVLPTKGAVIPAAVGVDIGCGMMALKLSLKKADLGDLHSVRLAIEKAVPAGRTNNGAKGDRGAWFNVPAHIEDAWATEFSVRYLDLVAKHPGAQAKNTYSQLGTLGTGNHFIELSEDEEGAVWIVLHSGSRGMGNKIGQYFTNLAKAKCAEYFVNLPDQDLAYLPQFTEEFADYKAAVQLAQDFALKNRRLMADAILETIADHMDTKTIGPYASWEVLETINCHHNYISWENHFGENIIVTRKGAVRARLGDAGIIPGSMGAKTYIVRGLGNPDSFCTCSHGAGRAMSRTQAVKQFTVEDHIKATEGVECLKDKSVLDETPAAYKDIDAVMAAQSDLVEIVHTLKQFVNVKGTSDSQ